MRVFSLRDGDGMAKPPGIRFVLHVLVCQKDFVLMIVKDVVSDHYSFDFNFYYILFCVYYLPLLILMMMCLVFLHSIKNILTTGNIVESVVRCSLPSKPLKYVKIAMI